MAFKTAMSVAAVALALVASAGAAAAAPARSAPLMAVATRQAVGGGSPQVVLVPQSAVPGGAFGKFFKRGDEKKYNVMIDVDIEKEEEKNPEYYGHKKGDEEEVNVKINVDVKKEKEEEEKKGVQLVSGLTGVVQPEVAAVATPPPSETNELPEQESQ